jgi:hypothetical protein
VGYRIQGVLLKQVPQGAQLLDLEHVCGYKLFELTGCGLWILDLDLPVPGPGDRVAIRAARPLAPSYVDALRVLGNDEQSFEQAPWLSATAGVARMLGQPVLGFLSDDSGLDFAAIATPDGVAVIGDTLEPYLIRWEAGSLVIQPYCGNDPNAEIPVVPEEMALIPAAKVLETERLTGGYPLHGNVVAETHGFAPAIEVLRIGTWGVGPVGSLRLVSKGRMDQSLWDKAAGAPGRQAVASRPTRLGLRR